MISLLDGKLPSDNFTFIRGRKNSLSDECKSIRFSCWPVANVASSGARLHSYGCSYDATSNRNRHGLGCAGISFSTFPRICSKPSTEKNKVSDRATELRRVQQWSDRDGQKKARYKLSPRFTLTWDFFALWRGNLRRVFALTERDHDWIEQAWQTYKNSYPILKAE